MSLHVDPLTLSPDGRRVTAFLRGPIKAGVTAVKYALATRACVRAGTAHVPLINGFPTMQDNLQDDEGIQSGGSFTANLVAPTWAYDTQYVTGYWDGYSLVSAYGASPIAFTRNLPIPVPDWEGVYRWTKADEFAPAAGCDRIENLCSAPESTAAWGLSGANAPAAVSTVVAGDTFSGVTFGTVGGTGFVNAAALAMGSTTAARTWRTSQRYAWRCRLFLSRPLTGAEELTLAVTGVDLTAKNVKLNAAFSPVVPTDIGVASDVVTVDNLTGTNSFYFYVSGALATPVSIYAKYFQMEDRSGASIQAPRRYVSKGVVTTWPYHGFGVDGVRWERGDTSASLAATSALTEGGATMQRQAWLYLPSRDGNFAHTPAAAAVYLSGDFEFVVEASINDLATTANQILASEWNGGIGFHFGIFPGSNKLYVHNNGSNYQSTVTLASLNLVNGVFYLWRASRVASSGDIKFDYSANGGVSWVAIGATVASPSGAAVPGINGLAWGGNTTGTQTLNGKVKRGELRNGINGTVVASFDAARFVAGGGSAVMATGETVTIYTAGAGNVAKIVEAFTEATQRPSRHDSAETQQFATDIGAWAGWSGGTATPTAAVGPDGLLSAFTLTDSDAASYRANAATAVVANDANPQAWHVKVKQDAVTNRFPAVEFLLSGGTTLRRLIHVNTATGATTAVGGVDGSHTVSDEGDGFWTIRGTITNNNSGNTTKQTSLYPAAATVFGTDSAAAQGSATFAWPMGVTGSRVSNFIPPGSGTRNEALLQFPGSIINNTEGFVYAEYQLDVVPTNDRRLLGDSAVNRTPLYIRGSSNNAIGTYDGVNNPGGTSALSTARTSIASAWSGATVGLWVNGALENQAAYDGSWDGTSWYVGASNAGASSPSGCIGPIKWGDRRPPSTFLANLNGAPDLEFTRPQFDELRDSMLGTTWEYELLTELVKNDVVTYEWSYKNRATVKALNVQPSGMQAQFAHVDLVGADRGFPFLQLTKTDWPNIFEADQNAWLPDGVGIMRKVPLRWITVGGGVWGYAGPRKRAGWTYSILAVYRDKAVVNASEYAAATRTAPSGYDVFCVNFSVDQFDPKGRHYDLMADFQALGPGAYNNREASAELDWLLQQYGYRTVASSVAAAITEDQTRGFFVDGAYVSPVAGRSLINELAQLARVRLQPDATGALQFIQDKPTASTFAFKESRDTVEVLSYEVPMPPKYVELKYRRLNAAGSEFEFLASRDHGAIGGSDSITIRNRFIDDHDVAQRFISLVSKRALTLKKVNLRFSAAQMFAGEVGTVDGVSCFRGVKTFMLLGGSRGGDASELRGREYDSTIYNPGSYTLPTGATNTYSPDYSETAPAAPTGLTYVSGSSGTSISADGVGRSYMFYQVTPPAANFTRILFTAVDGANQVTLVEAKKNGSVYEATLTGLRPGVSHTVQAQAININGIPGAIVSETRTSPGYAVTPGAPTMLAAGGQVGSKKLQFVFSPSSSPNIDYYEYSITSNFGASYGSAVRTAGTPIDYSFPTVGSTYGCRARAVDKFGNVSAWSNTYYWATSTFVSDPVITPGGVGNGSITASTLRNGRLNVTVTTYTGSIAAGAAYEYFTSGGFAFMPILLSTNNDDFMLTSTGGFGDFRVFNRSAGASTLALTLYKLNA